MPKPEPRFTIPTPKPFKIGEKWKIPLFIFLSFYLLIGTLGKPPWPQSDLLNIAIAHLVFISKQWFTIPDSLSLDQFTFALPYYYWLTTGLAYLLNKVLSFYEAVRLLSTLCSALLLYSIFKIVSLNKDTTTGFFAILLSGGTIGFLVLVHEAQPIIMGVSLASLTYLSLEYYHRHGEKNITPIILLMASSSAFALLTAGIIPVLPLLIVPVLFFIFDTIQKRHWSNLFVFLLTFFAIFFIGLWMLIYFEPKFFDIWLKKNLIFITNRTLPTLGHFELFFWFSLPIFPLALWSLWSIRKQYKTFHFQYLITSLALTLLWYLSGPVTKDQAFPILFPLLLIASLGVNYLKRGACQAIYWFSILTAVLALLYIWIAAIALWTGYPSSLASHLTKIRPEYQVNFSLLLLLLGLVITAGFFYISYQLHSSKNITPWLSIVQWSISIAVIWMLLGTIGLNWMSSNRDYRPIMGALQNVMQSKKIDCVAIKSLRSYQRAAFAYHFFPKVRSASLCSYLLVSETVGKNTFPEHLQWQLIWSRKFPDRKKDFLKLYEKK